MRALVTVAVCAALFAGCAKKPAPAPAATFAKDSRNDPPLPSQTQAAAMDKEKQPRVKDAAVYVDGKIVAFLKAHELPVGLKPAPTHRGQVEYGMVSYLKAIGVDVAKVKGLHMHAGRISMMSGDALRKGGDRIRIGFQADGLGKPRPVFDGGVRPSLGLNTTIDLIGALAVYVEKEPPHENADYDLEYPDGKRVEGMPYADSEASAGTRVYVDGKLVTIVKRKALSNDLLVTNDLSKPEFSFAAYLKQAGVDLAKSKSVDFISNDVPLGRFDAGTTATMTFAVPARNQGLAVFELPGRTQQTKITAIQLYQTTTAPNREAAAAKPATHKTQG